MLLKLEAGTIANNKLDPHFTQWFSARIEPKPHCWEAK